MIFHQDINDSQLRSLIRKGVIVFAGNRKLRIYGTLTCKSGKRMKKHNRVFFGNASEAWAKGYRPCGHCMKLEYRKW
ncbi:MAG TPA: Ada metal-binding domain-containing protein [Ohtaekwangia sp.]